MQDVKQLQINPLINAILKILGLTLWEEQWFVIEVYLKIIDLSFLIIYLSNLLNNWVL